MGKTKTWAIGITFLCTLLTSTAQVFMKFGAQRLTVSVQGILFNFPLIIALMIYAVGSVVMIIALKHGELSVVYPILATSYVWVTFLSAFFFGEVINHFKLLGVLSIIAGVTFIGLGGTR